MSSMSTPPTTALFSIFEAALNQYQKKTKRDLRAHPLFSQLQACDSPADILTILQDQVDQSTQSRTTNERLKRWLGPTISVLYAFSETLGAGVSLVFSPANVIFAGAGVLLSAVKDVENRQDALIDVFRCIENVFRRLEIYTQVPPTPAMTHMMVEIMVEVLDILGTATKEMKQGRAKTFLVKVAGKTNLEDRLKRLDNMASDVIQMANIELQKSYGINVVRENVQAVINDGEEIETEAKMMMQQVAYNVNEAKLKQVRERFRWWQSPPDPFSNHNTECDIRLQGTTEWFFRGGVFDEWNSNGSLLWIHGKPGSGKSVLCSAIIQKIPALYDAGSAFLAYFYFDFRDTDKISRRNLLSSLLDQLSTHSDPCCGKLYDLYRAYDNGANPSDGALVQCLKDMLILLRQAPVYIILDALNDCPNTSVFRSPRGQVLELVKELDDLHLPCLRICVTSRPEVDIQDNLKSIVSHSVSLHDERGQKQDIVEYVRSMIFSDPVGAIKRWKNADKDLVFETLSKKADGMFLWVFCQLEMLRYTLSPVIRRVLDDLPASLDETYERILMDINKQNRHNAYILLQCLSVAIRPLCVEELAEILVFDFDGFKDIPKLNEDLRWEDAQEAILSVCSSLIIVVNDGLHRVVRFSHLSVKEFLFSERLAISSADISLFHIIPESAHTVLAKACLGILLHSDSGVGNAKAESNSPLAKYAAKHWVDHARFRNVSEHLQVGIRLLFDPAMPYFEAWLKLYDIDQEWIGFTDNSKQQRRGSPLYYASLCGFRDLTAHLVAKYPQHVNTRLGRCSSPLAAALHKRHFDIADLLYQHGADVDIRGFKNQTLLHAASAEGFLDVAHWLLKCGAGVNARDEGHNTPLHLAWSSGSPDTMRLLIDHGADVDAFGGSHNTPLHLASSSGSPDTVRLLIDHGADANAFGGSHNTPLHLASSLGSPEAARPLLEYGADVSARDEDHNTPLHLASFSGNPDTVQLLIDHGADVNTMGGSHDTPMHLAESSGSLDTMQVLIKHGADVSATDGSNKMPLLPASSSVAPEPVQDPIEHGPDVDAIDGNKEMPLHPVSFSWSPDNVRSLIERRLDVNARDWNHRTPLHLASSLGDLETVRVLIERGADVNSRDGRDNTPLHLASSLRSPEIVRLLLDNEAVVTSRDRGHWTPLHQASSSGTPNTVDVLIWYGADVEARDKNKNTPLHLASSSGSPETVRMLLDNDAAVNAKDGKQRTPLHLASSSWSPETVQVLIDYGATVRVMDKNQKMPLHLASSSWCPEIVRLLIHCGTHVDSRDGSLNTPLHLASSSRIPEAVRLLIELGANVNAKDGSGNTPLHLALTSWSPETVRLLVEHGADVNKRNGDGKTPLHLASSQNETSLGPTENRRAKSNEKADIVRVLIQKGADVTAKDKTDSTPLHLASSKGSGRTVELLLTWNADVNAQDTSKSTPLHLAASAPLAFEENVVHLLLSSGADADAKDNRGQIPYQIAISKQLWDIAELLLAT